MKRIRYKKFIPLEKPKKRVRASVRQKLLFKDGQLTKREYKKLRSIPFHYVDDKSVKLRSKDFRVEIVRILKLKDGGKRKIEVNASEFKQDEKYEIYIRHKKTKQRRLLAIGKLFELPIVSHQKEIKGRPLGGRTFDASLKSVKRAKGRWVPVSRIVHAIQRELEEMGMDMRSEVRASIIPMKRYFHTKWLVYSDNPIPGNTLINVMFVHCAVRFVYPNMDWIGKQAIRFEFKDERMHRRKLKNLHKLLPVLEKAIDRDLHLLHPNASDVGVMQINGFIIS